MTVAQFLESLGIVDTTAVPNTNHSMIIVKNPGTAETQYELHQSISDLSISHGTLLTLTSNTPKSKTKSVVSHTTFQKSESSERRFDPFPELARDYKTAQRKAQIARVRKSSSSFTDLSNLRDSLHVVEPQTQGSVQRVYMCERSARWFYQNGGAAASKQAPSSSYQTAAFLFGTITRERKDTQSRRPAKTSLSSTKSREPEEYVSAVRVHAIYEPPTSSTYSTTALSLENILDRVFRVAGYLGMEPVGWIFSYDDDRRVASKKGTSHKETNDKEVPISKENMVLASHLQIQNMKNKLNHNLEPSSSSSSCWVTLAMNSVSGETEAFQISDVTVQMVAEDMLLLTPDTSNNDDDPRHIHTKYPIIIDGKETKTLDIVLCLINTAMLSHKGTYSGVQRGDSDLIVQAVRRKSGDLTTKTRKAIQQALTASSNGSNNSDAAFFETVCEFSTLVALDALLSMQESQKLCTLVRKWSRGQRQSTTLDETLRRRLLSILSTP